MEETKLSYKRPFPDDEDPQNKPSSNKRVRFPKGKKSKTAELVVGTSQTDDGVQNEWETDPHSFAKARAKRRSQMTTDLCSEESRGILHDITTAEVNYEEHENFMDDGIQIEPFNLRREREEGFFDSAGNFIEYLDGKEIKDAWLDSVEIDPCFLERASLADDNEEVVHHDLSSTEIGKIKRRIADLLEPGETILRALKRMKGTSNSKKEKMPPEIKVLFDELTDYAAKLMENGDYNVYHENKEVFEREAEGYERLAQAGVEDPSSSGNDHSYPFIGKPSAAFNSTEASSVQGNGADSVDMFADDDETIPVMAPSDAQKLHPDIMDQRYSEALNMDPECGAVQSDYVYDDSSGYYYSSSYGYYYDPCSKLYCCASSGQWYSFNEVGGVYEEI